tara:strand:+ start:434 stop:1042 length:609 start_codon:yes stop_codon:yes gene_type:complete
MENEKLHLSYIEFFPDYEIDRICKDLEYPVETYRIESTPQASIEWLAPAMVAAYVTKPFFEAFFKKAGEDSYLAFVDGLRKLREAAKQHLGGFSRHKDEKKQTPLFSFSVGLPKSKCNLRFMIENSLESDKLGERFFKLLAICEPENLDRIDSHYAKFKEDGGTPYPTIYLRYSTTIEHWEFFDPFKELSLELNKKKNESGK